MSTDYYTRLEQQRGPQPSEQMLALARPGAAADQRRARLPVPARRPQPARTPPRPPRTSRPRCCGCWTGSTDTPALILSSLGETLVQNRMAAALLGDRSGYTGLARSEIYRWFTDPAERLRLPRGRPRPAEPGPGREPARRLRGDGPAVAGRRDSSAPCRRTARSSPGCGSGTRSPSASRTTRSLIHPELGPIELEQGLAVRSRAMRRTVRRPGGPAGATRRG